MIVQCQIHGGSSMRGSELHQFKIVPTKCCTSNFSGANLIALPYIKAFIAWKRSGLIYVTVCCQINVHICNDNRIESINYKHRAKVVRKLLIPK